MIGRRENGPTAQGRREIGHITIGPPVTDLKVIGRTTITTIGPAAIGLIPQGRMVIGLTARGRTVTGPAAIDPEVKGLHIKVSAETVWPVVPEAKGHRVAAAKDREVLGRAVPEVKVVQGRRAKVL